MTSKEMFNWLEKSSFDLRHQIHGFEWAVVDKLDGSPMERLVGYGKTITDAINMAITNEFHVSGKSMYGPSTTCEVSSFKNPFENQQKEPTQEDQCQCKKQNYTATIKRDNTFTIRWDGVSYPGCTVLSEWNGLTCFEYKGVVGSGKIILAFTQAYYQQDGECESTLVSISPDIHPINMSH
jgi:hypothetical protein